LIPAVKLEQSSGSHLTGYCIYPAIRFYELTGYTDALSLAEGLTRWALDDPVLGADGAITSLCPGKDTCTPGSKLLRVARTRGYPSRSIVPK
jgi:hypothetical protein